MKWTPKKSIMFFNDVYGDNFKSVEDIVQIQRDFIGRIFRRLSEFFLFTAYEIELFMT